MSPISAYWVFWHNAQKGIFWSLAATFSFGIPSPGHWFSWIGDSIISIGCSALWETGITHCFHRYNRQILVFFTYSTEPVPGFGVAANRTLHHKKDNFFSAEIDWVHILQIIVTAIENVIVEPDWIFRISTCVGVSPCTWCTNQNQQNRRQQGNEQKPARAAGQSIPFREFTENKIPNFKIIPCYYKVL